MRRNQYVENKIKRLIQPSGGGGGGGATNLTWVAGTSTVTSDTGTDAVITVADGTNPGLMSSSDFTKLAGISGTPGGSNTQVQFNNSSAFGGSADFTFDDSTNTLALGGTNTSMNVAGVTNNPSAPSSTLVKVYAKPFVGRVIPAWVDSVFTQGLTQSAMFDGRHRFMWSVANSSTGITPFGDTVAAAGTYALRGAQSPWTGVHGFPTYASYANVITTLNQVVGIAGSNTTFYRSTTSGSQGGFLHYARWGYDTWTNGGRHFNGYTPNSSTVISADPSLLNNTVGFAVDVADNGLIHFLTRGAAATKTSTGLTITSGKGYHTWFYAPFNNNNIYWRIQDIDTGTIAEGVNTTNLPAVDVRLVVAMRTSNAALTAATAVRLGVAFIYGETAQ